MNIDKFRRQHVAILNSIARLRTAVQGGIVEHAADIAGQIVAMSGVIKLHLAIEDSTLYPALANGADARLARMSNQYQQEMQGIVQDYLAFAGRWNLASRLVAQPEQFRADANHVLRVLYQRIKKEDHEFYPAIENEALSHH
jgi:hemerythrin-like domain-containing protein